MIHRIEIYPKTKLVSKDKKINVDVYTINKELTIKQLECIASALSNPISQIYFIDKPTRIPRFSFAVETGYLPGVTDNIANTAKEIIEDLLKIKFRQQEGIYSSRLIFYIEKISVKEIELLKNNLINPLIQRLHVKNFQQYIKENGMDRIVPKVMLDEKLKVDTVNLDVSDEELMHIGKAGIANKDGSRHGPLALDLTYMKTIQSYFKKLKRNPTDVELESIAQTWSEHCKHTIFADPIDNIQKGLFNTYIKKATEKIIRKIPNKKRFCVSVFKDNSGAIVFDETFLITHKVETHNSPSALDPFGGAITGIVGVNRDAIGFGMGAKPIVNTYGFCFANQKDSKPLYKDKALLQKMLSPRRIMDGVIEGVNVGGNCSGIPTPQGFLYFDNRYQGKPLVFVGTIGLIPKKIHAKRSYIKKANPHDYIVMVGGRVGQDGIHGATFSSEAMDTGSPATAVQIGDPITQKKLSDAIVKEARDRNLYTSITDNGAGGLSCSVAEMAKESGGCTVMLEKIPLKYPGLEPWKIWISESQERMTLSVPKNKWKKFSSLMKRRGVEATIIGEFTNSGRCIVSYHKRIIMDIDMKFLHDGLPPRPMKTTLPKNVQSNISFPKSEKNLNIDLLKMLCSPNIAGFEFISTQYDHEVQGTSVIKPLQGKGRINGETTVIKPLLNSKKGVVISQGMYPSYSEIDSYNMAACSIDTAIRNAVATGANIDRLALLDNFCWCSLNEPERLWQLKQSAKACFDYAVVFKTPFISGKDSMFNDFKGYDEKSNPVKISVPPTLLISSIGIIDDVLQTVSIDSKYPGDLVYILGDTFDELGGSEYFSLYNLTGGSVPEVDALKNRKLYINFYKCVKKNIISSAISVTRGGLGIALAKTAMAGMLGVEVSLKNNYILFSESQGRILVTIDPKNKKQFEQMMKKNALALIGTVINNQNIIIKNKEQKNIIHLDVQKALKAYKSAFRNY